LNTAEYFGLDKDIGSITPGRYADIVISGDLSTLPIEVVIAGGAIVAEDGELQIDIPPYPYPIFATDTVHLGKSLEALDFDIPAPSTKAVNVRVVGIVENQAPTQSLTRVLPVDKGVVQLDPRLDVAHLALVERHRGTGNVVSGFVAGFGFSFPCGIASTVAHDSHHMVVAGTSKHNMAAAVNRLSETEGGVAVFKDGEEIALVELQIAGLMSTERAEVVAEKAKRMTEAFRECGCEINNAFMQLSLLALVVIPELRISDLGIVDVTKFEIVPLFVD
jgi:adenine deaminase